LDSTSRANASGKIHGVFRCFAMDRDTAAREMAARIIIVRRPPRLRSSAGPSTGATTANGAIVSRRYAATRPRAADGEMEKNRDPARAMVTRVSPATPAQ
jgi:hypothetical protein